MRSIIIVLAFLLCASSLSAQTAVTIYSDIPATIFVDYRPVMNTPCKLTLAKNTYTPVSIRDINGGSWSGKLYSGFAGPREISLEYSSKTFRVTRTYPNMIIQHYYYYPPYCYDRPFQPLHSPTPRVIPWRQHRNRRHGR